MFSCGAKGRFGIRISVSTGKATYPIQVFREGRTLLDVLRLKNYVPVGTISGRFKSGNSIWTLNPSDIFAYGRGGAIVPDTDLSDADVPAFELMISDVYNQMKTDVAPLLDNYLASVFLKNGVVAQYRASTPLPTRFGFLRWFVDQNADLRLYLSSSNRMSLLMSCYTNQALPLTDEAFVNIQAKSVAMNSGDWWGTPNITNSDDAIILMKRFQAVFQNSVYITNFRVTDDTSHPKQFIAVAKVHAKITNRGKRWREVYGTFSYSLLPDSMSTHVITTTDDYWCSSSENIGCHDLRTGGWPEKMRHHMRELKKQIEETPHAIFPLAPLNVKLTYVGPNYPTSIENAVTAAADAQLGDWSRLSGLDRILYFQRELESAAGSTTPIIVLSGLYDTNQWSDDLQIILHIRTIRLSYFSMTEGLEGVEVPFSKNMRFPVMWILV